MKVALFYCLSLAVAFAANTEVEEFAASNNEFTGDVYAELLVNNKNNLLVSPFSLETILALTQSGAVGDTGAEIRNTLHLPESKEETDALIKKVLPTIHNQHYTLHTANKVYVEENFAINEDFKKVATSNYEASFQNIEFAQNIEAAAEINKWVEEQTENKIHDLVSSDDLDASTRVVLVNALYFEANWSMPFVPVLCSNAPFFTSAEETIDVDFMFKESEEFNYAESEELDAQIVELPFEGEGASMVIVVPNQKEGIAILEKQPAALLAAPAFKKEFVQLSLPKFKIESSIDFNSVLMDLGVHKAFDPEQADLSGLAGSPGELVIGKVAQKTFIDVNEIGVVAAAATEVATPTDVGLPADKIVVVDHPFVFYIKVNDIVLFEGRVLVPEYDN